VDSGPSSVSYHADLVAAEPEADAPVAPGDVPSRGSDRTGAFAHRFPADLIAVMLCLVSVPLVHRLGPALRSPYWLDEAWVALSAKVPVIELPTTTASSPIGWTFLVWLLPAHGQIHRVIPLTFLGGSVAASYGFARMLGWPIRALSMAAGGACAAAVLLLPAQQTRHDLKQYTADAAVALAVLALLARAEAVGSWRAAATLAALVPVAMLLSHPAIMVGAAGLAGLLIVAAFTREWRRLAVLSTVGGLTLVGVLAVYVAFDHRADNAGMSAYWSDYFPSPTGLPSYTIHRLAQLRPAIGVPWTLFALLDVIGVVALARLRRPATAAAVVLVPLLAAAAGVERRYPVLDQRTSHFLLVTGAAVAMVGLSWAATLITSRLPGRARVATTVSVLVFAVGAFAITNRGVIRSTAPPGGRTEDVAAQVEYVAAHRRPGDVILVNLSGQYGFAYYWSQDRPTVVRGGVQATGWHVRYPVASRIVVATGRDRPAVASALADARWLASGDTRIWLVRSHVNSTEAAAWTDALAAWQVQTIAVGPEPLALLTAEQALRR
jgi:hypothetical protein